MNAVILILSDSRGRYIPRDFLTDNYGEIAVDHCAAWGLNDSNYEQWYDALEPENECYWESWEWILNNAQFNDGENVYRLYQDGDLWGICYELMTDEEKHNFGFED